MDDSKISRAIIFGAAPCVDFKFLASYLGEKSWLVVCADGGVKNAKTAGLTPNALIGDWDSGGAPESGLNCTTLPVEKDMTDLQAAVDLALSRGAKELLLCGCTGGRLDHTASNLVLLEWIAGRGGAGVIADGDNEVRYLDSVQLLLPNTPPFRYLSVIPLDREIFGVSLRGVKYPLTDAMLTRGDTLSISNEPDGACAEISIGSGRVLIVRSERL